MKQATFEATYPPDLVHPLHRGVVEDSGVSRAAVLQWGPTDGVSTLSWFDADRATIRALLDRVESVSDRSLVDGGAGTYAFVHQTAFEFDDALLARLAAARVVFVPPVTFLDTGGARFHAVGEPDALGEFHAEISELLDVRIERVRGFRRGPAPATLTDRQDDALSAAVAAGYYEVPRTGTVADVADRLGCARSTAGELLRKAEARLVADHVAAEPDPVSDGGSRPPFAAPARTAPMADYEVECVTVDYDAPHDDCRAIEAIGFESVDGGITRKTPREVHRMVADTDDEVHVVYHGERSRLRAATDGERRYVRTADEDTAEDPLMKQPSC